jgi:hypothetical protein
MYTGFCWYKDSEGKQNTLEFRTETTEEIEELLVKGEQSGWKEYKLRAVDPNDINIRVRAAKLTGWRKLMWDYFAM